jgi:hypothetical protein
VDSGPCAPVWSSVRATAATTATLLCKVTGSDTGDKLVQATWTLAAPILDVDRTALTQGADNTITVPTGASVCVIVPPSTNTQAITFKGIGADTGYAIDADAPTVLGLSGSSFVLNLAAGSNQTVEFNWI